MTKYIVTGVDVYGKRFRLETTNKLHAMWINLHKGSVWEELPNGRRKLLKREGW